MSYCKVIDFFRKLNYQKKLKYIGNIFYCVSDGHELYRSTPTRF